MTTKYNQTYTKSDCLESLIEAERRLGHSPSQTEYNSLDIRPSVYTIKNKCGGWNSAKKQAGQTTVEFDNTRDVDTTFFQEIDSPETAYWLGFLFGDGYVTYSENSGAWGAGLELSASDRDHLRKFKQAIGSDHTLQEMNYDGRPSTVRIVIYQDAFIDPLKKHGMSLGKTFDASLPAVPDDLKNHFVRGLFDADGHYSDRYRNQTWLISGSESRLQKIAKWLPVQSKLYNTKTDVRICVMRKEDRLRLHKWLYPNREQTEPLLERKYLKAATDLF